MMWAYGMGWFAWMVMASFWVLFVAGVVWLVRSVGGRPTGDLVSSARRILDDRFAAGELSAEDYEPHRRVLR